MMDRFFERDLSWLSFNHRVLQESQDKSVPILERLKFLAIYSSNMDEFYRVRVAGYNALIKRGGKKSLWAERILERIRAQTDRQQQKFGRIYREQILPELQKHNIHIIDDFSTLMESQLEELREKFESSIKPHLEFHELTEGEFFLENRVVYFIIRSLEQEIKYYICRVPVRECGRFITVQDDERQVVIQLDDLIRWFIPSMLQSSYDIYSIKANRDAELYLKDEFGGDLVARILKSLGKRDTGSVSRLLYQDSMPKEMQKIIRRRLRIRKRKMIPGGRYHNFYEFFSFPVNGKEGLSFEQLPSLTHRRVLSEPINEHELKKNGDLLLHFPYHDYGQVIDFLEKVVNDPQTRAIHITLYRVAKESAICKLLIQAAKKGIDVVVFDEVKARFDEDSNIYWGKELEKAGAKVDFGFDDIKVHTKLLHVIKDVGRKDEHITYLGTGNFNENTSGIYADFSLITVDQKIGREVNQLFRFLEGEIPQPNFEELIVAHFDLRDRLCELIDAEIKNASQGKEARISLKMNSLEDKGMISKLYEASRAGVKIRIIVRGICCLVPGIEGMSENIEIISIVDRYLEHSRLFWFHSNGENLVYLASADWMKRNLNRRIEVAIPIKQDHIREELMDYYEIQWSDNVKARKINIRQTNPYIKNKDKKVRSQYEQYSRLIQRGDQES